ncbi:MAG: hypothetical protein LBR84_04315 [Tannerella sp.]|jgi:hypothetical protein|nr:hypothetical protein [Tannerella sp.]
MKKRFFTLLTVTDSYGNTVFSESVSSIGSNYVVDVMLPNVHDLYQVRISRGNNLLVGYFQN